MENGNLWLGRTYDYPLCHAILYGLKVQYGINNAFIAKAFTR